MRLRGRFRRAAMRSLLVERDQTLAPAESDLETLLLKILREADQSSVVSFPIRLTV